MIYLFEVENYPREFYGASGIQLGRYYYDEVYL